MSKQPRKLRQLLASGESGLAALGQQARHYGQLHKLVLQTLSPQAQPHCLGVHYDTGRLTLYIDSTAWLSRLRFELTAIRLSLRKQPAFSQLHDIRLRVINIPAPAPKREPRLSRQSATLIDEAASTTRDPALREALKRLARRGK